MKTFANVVAADSNVNITIYRYVGNSRYVDTANFSMIGEYREIETGGTMHILSTGPLVVAQYSQTGTFAIIASLLIREPRP